MAVTAILNGKGIDKLVVVYKTFAARPYGAIVLLRRADSEAWKVWQKKK